MKWANRKKYIVYSHVRGLSKNSTIYINGKESSHEMWIFYRGITKKTDFLQKKMCDLKVREIEESRDNHSHKENTHPVRGNAPLSPLDHNDTQLQ